MARDAAEEKKPVNSRDGQQGKQNRQQGANQQGNDPKPWRTEGMPEEPQMPEPPKWWAIIVWLLVGWLVLFGFTSVQDAWSNPSATIPYSEFTKQVQDGNVEEVFSRGDTIEGSLIQAADIPDDSGNRQYQYFTTERPTFAQDDLLAQLENKDVVVSATPLVQERGTFWNIIISLLPMLIIFGLWFWIIRRAQKNAGELMGGAGAGGAGGMFGGGKKSKRVDPEKVRVTFDDVAGIDEVEAEVYEIVDFLKNPEKYTRLGAKAPKGVLLEGAPGTGKTLLARATAGEADVPFFSASASEFIEMIVGVGAQRVRELFEEARKVAPAIIFIDEIDTIGRSRSSSRSMGGNDEREQTLNQILTEMDGFDGSEGVVVIAATNRADVLDDALTRAGRFDRKITVSAPDAKGREQILQVHTRNKPLADDVDLMQVAKVTPGLTGADLANLANEAAILAAKREDTHLHASDFSNALEKIQLGAERGIVMPEEEKLRTAYHEAGHALLGMLRPGADPVRKISIIPRGRALGVTVSTPESDRYGYDVDYLRGRIMGALGGMAAEEEIFGVITTGAESDLQTVTNIARQMVGRWGMSEKVGPVQVYPQDGDPRQSGASERLLELVDEEVRALVVDCYAETRKVLRENRVHHDSLVAALLEKETLDEAEAYEAAGLVHQPARPLLVGAKPGSPGHENKAVPEG
ncbi:ATP-dependent zinc metalloprotease FtsH [Gulosibacter molinativorax]|uniref:ATP-dependent zinc metalloprotease FtsH n=1 Tax=Gulosibacter molinativorax TaxID=256821 RepID=A0ABT7C7K1_9MICO|nr:ATP-dependent zinc metalloprotease FtsH [Gulosibacter molinativorax]MDJ1371186.1 ATP-dependent metallopeptidase FtsH/Yme1/Tma family protein [Gulosibacter molinativorax]QUY63001.1 ATP-dependent zinc metalloprotease FtsH [Gulosibacter molinativorax]